MCVTYSNLQILFFMLQGLKRIYPNTDAYQRKQFEWR